MNKFLRNNNTLSGRLKDELIMMDIQKGKYFSLNHVATRIWDLLEVPMNLKEICDILVVEYKVDEAQCSEEVGELLNEMMKLGLVIELK